MCLLIAITPNAVLDEDRLYTAAENNPDGFGWAIHTGTHLIRFRSMWIDEAVHEWKIVRHHFPEAHAVWHLRWATHGTTDLANCHPFEVGHDSRLMLAHNGVLPITAKGSRSDTRILAEDEIANLNPSWLDNADDVEAFEKWIRGSKVVFLSAHPDTDRDMYIMNESDGHWDNGVWWSNRSYQPYRKPCYGGSSPSLGIWARTLEGPTQDTLELDSDDDLLDWMEVDCQLCGTEYVADWNSQDRMSCPECGTCYFCDSDSKACGCWEAELGESTVGV